MSDCGVAVTAMRAESRHRAVRQTEFTCQSTYPPAALRFRRLTGQGLYFLPNPGIVFWWPARARRIAAHSTPALQTIAATSPPSPEGSLDPRQSAGLHARCRRQDNLAPQHQRLCCGRRCTQLFKVALVGSRLIAGGLVVCPSASELLYITKDYLDDALVLVGAA